MSGFWELIPSWYHQDVTAVLFLLAVLTCHFFKTKLTPRGGRSGCAVEPLLWFGSLFLPVVTGALLWPFMGLWTVVIAMPLAYFIGQTVERWKQPSVVLAVATILLALGHIARPATQLAFFERFGVVEFSRYGYGEGPDGPELTDKVIRETEELNDTENAGRNFLVTSAKLRIKGVNSLSKTHYSSCLIGLGMLCFAWFLVMPFPPEKTGQGG